MGLKPGRVINNEWRRKTNARSVRTVEALAQYLAVEVEFVAPGSIRTPDGQTADGEYDAKTGRIRIDSRAKDPILAVVKHEMTHRLRSLAPAEYKAYCQFVLSAILDGDYAAEASQKVHSILDVYQRTGEFTMDAALEEFVADFSVNLLSNERLIRKLCRENMRLGQRILEWIKDMLAAIGRAKEAIQPQFRTDYGLTEAQLKKAEQFYIEGLRAANRQAQKLLAESRGQADGSTTNAAAGATKRYKIAELQGEKSDYGPGVILDTALFNGVSPRNWGPRLKEYVYEHLAGAELTMYDSGGNAETVYLARANDRGQKDGAKNSHKVIDKLARYKGDNVRALATVHLSEALETSRYENDAEDHTHQWMDEKGWTYRTAYLQDRSGNIYEATLNIANGRNRRILYDISNIRQIDKVDKKRAPGGIVSSTIAGRDSLTSRGSDYSISGFDEKYKQREENSSLADKKSAQENRGGNIKYSAQRAKPVDFPISRWKDEQVPFVRVNDTPTYSDGRPIFTTTNIDQMENEADAFIKESGMKNKTVTVKDGPFAIDVRMDYSDGLRKTVKAQIRNSAEKRALLYVLPSYEKILKTSKYFGNSDPGKGKAKVEKFNYLVNAVKVGNDYYAVKTTLTITPTGTIDKMHGYVLDDIDVAKINIPTSQQKSEISALQSAETLRGASGDVDSISIFDLFNSVNVPSYYQNFIRVALTDKKGMEFSRKEPDSVFAEAMQKARDRSSRYSLPEIRQQAESRGQEKSAQESRGGEKKYSLKRSEGKNFVWIANSQLTNKELNDATIIANYISQYIGEIYTILESGQKVYIGKELPGEYTHSSYTSYLRSNHAAIYRAKNRVLGELGELIETANNRRWEKTKHTHNKDAKYGMYRYDGAFAFPVKNNEGNVTKVRAYDVELLIRNASDGKKYLYDIVNIKENTTASYDLSQKETRLTANNAVPRGSASESSISESGEKGNAKYSLPELRRQERERMLEKEKLLSIESYSAESYERYGWAAVNGLLNEKELASFLKKIGQIAGGEKGKRTRKGQYIIPVGEKFGINNKLIFSNGDYQNPSIEKVIAIDLDNETEIDEVRRDIYAAETEPSSPFSSEAVQLYFEQWLCTEYSREDWPDYWQAGGTQGAGLQGDAGASGELPNGSRSAGEDQGSGSLGSGSRYSLPELRRQERERMLEKEKLLSVESYSAESYERYGWAAVNGLLNEKELAAFLKKIGQLASGEKGKRTRKGQYIIPVGEKFGINNKLIFSNGDYQNPSIEKVVEIDLYTETEIDRIRRVIYDRESKPGTLPDQSLGDAFREELFCIHLREYYPTYAELIGESQRGIRQASAATFGALRDGRRSSGEDQGSGSLGSGSRYSLPELRRQERERMRLREEVDYLKGELKQNRGKDADPKQMKALAGQLLLEYGSTYDRAELNKALLELYRLVRQGQDPQPKAEEIAGKLLESAEAWQEEAYQDYQELRTFLAERGGSLRQESRTDLAELWPEWFPEDADTQQIEATLEHLRRIYEGPSTTQMQKGWIAADICQRMFAIPPRETYADKEARKLAESRLAERMHEGRDAAEAKRLLALEREKRKAQVAALQEKQRSGKKAQSRKQKEKELRARIQRAARRLSPKLLRPNNEKHIPEELRQAVAQLLAAINLESSYSISPATGRKLPYAGGTPTKKTEAFRALRQRYLKIAREQGNLPLSLDPMLLENLAELGGMEEKPISQLSLEELEMMWQTVKAVEASIETANKALGTAQFATIQQAAEGLLAENRDKAQKQEYGKGFARVDRLLNMDMLTPEAFFHRLGKAGDDIFRMLSDGRDRQIRILQQAAQDSQKLLGEADVRKLEEEGHSFVLESGKKLRMSTAQIMSLAMLLERPQARQHILEGGLRPKSFQGRNGVLTQPTEALHVTEADCAAILSVLSREQLALAARLQGYMCRELAEVGNQASLEVYGYQKFTDPDYFPIEVDRNQVGRDAAPQAQGQTIAGWSSAQQTVEGAGNALMLDSIFAVYTQHISGMASFCAWLAPLENLRRIRDYHFRDKKGQPSGTVKGLIQSVLGKEGLAYLDQLMEDLNQAMQLRNSGFTDKLISNVKAAAVAANVRVIIQQPTAILRALAEIDGKYLSAGALRKGDWERVMQYAPIARWKDWGHFDVNTGRQLRDVLLGTDSSLEKAKQAGMWLAGKADSLSWRAIWNAVELETRAERQDLPPGTEEFYQAVGARFTEVINKTQVVDGLLQRSQIMRSPDALTRLSTAFMGEPTKTYNMFLNAVYDLRKAQAPEAKKASRRKLARTALALNVALVSNAVAQSLVDALRDDDKEKRYWEKWLEAFSGFSGEEESFTEYWKSFWSGNLEAAWNPLTYIPYAKDVLSIVQGYEASRLDLDSVEKVVRAAINFYKALQGAGKQAVGSAALGLLTESARLLGLPLANLRRDIQAILITWGIETENYVYQYRLDRFLYNPQSNKGRFWDILYTAHQKDKEAFVLIREALLQEGFSEEDLEKAIVQRQKEEETYLEALESLESGMLERLEGKSAYRALSAERKEATQRAVEDYAKALAYWQTYKKEPLEGWKAKARSARKDLGLSPEQYILLRQRYGRLDSKGSWNATVDAQGRYEKMCIAKELIGISPGDYLQFCAGLAEYDADGNGSYTHQELEAAVEAAPGLSKEQQAMLWQLQTGNESTKNNPFSRKAAREFLKKTEEE